MNKCEKNRAEILHRVTQGSMTVPEAAKLLALSRRQVQRLLRSFRTDGPVALQHKARGQPSNNRTEPTVRIFATQLLEEKYAGFGPTLAAEKLAKEHGLKISRETLRKWMQDSGIGVSRKQRRIRGQPLTCRKYYGELILIYSFQNIWYKDRNSPRRLLVFMDDATSKVMHLEFVTSPDIFSYFNALRSYLKAHGRPVAFCGDRRTLLRAARESARSSHGTAQIARALYELDIGLIFAKTGIMTDRFTRVAHSLSDDLFG
jgi:transposase